MNEKFIKKFEIEIGSPGVAGFPLGDPWIMFKINDRFNCVELKEFKKWIDTILDSKGNRNENAYKAKKNLDEFFAELLLPWIILPEIEVPK